MAEIRLKMAEIRLKMTEIRLKMTENSLKPKISETAKKCTKINEEMAENMQNTIETARNSNSFQKNCLKYLKIIEKFSLTCVLCLIRAARRLLNNMQNRVITTDTMAIAAIISTWKTQKSLIYTNFFVLTYRKCSIGNSVPR